MYTIEDIRITAQELWIRRDRYLRYRICRIEARCLRWHDHLVRIVSYGLLFSAVGWTMGQGAFGLMLGSGLFATGCVLALLSSHRYALRAEFVGNNETGPQWVTLARGWRQKELTLFQDIAGQLASKRQHE